MQNTSLWRHKTIWPGSCGAKTPVKGCKGIVKAVCWTVHGAFTKHSNALIIIYLENEDYHVGWALGQKTQVRRWAEQHFQLIYLQTQPLVSVARIVQYPIKLGDIYVVKFFQH